MEKSDGGYFVSSLITHRNVFALAVPMIISNLTVPLLGLVDTAVVGHMDSPVYLGAVAVGAMVFAFLFWGFGFLRMGVTGLTAQAQGANDADGTRAHLARGLILAVVIGVTLIVSQSVLFDVALRWVDASAAVTRWSGEYLEIRIWAAPFTLSTYVCIGWLLGMQDARSPMLVTILTNGVNVVLDLWFVVVLEWGVPGVAGASLVAEVTGAALAGWMVWRRLSKVGGRVSGERLLDRRELVHTLAVNRDIMIRTLLLIFAFAFFTRQGAQFGDTVLAANAILLNFQDVLAYGLDGFAHAAEALVGRTVGEDDRFAMERAVRLCALWSAGLAAVAGIGFWVFGGALIELMTSLTEVRETARQYLPWIILSPLISVWSFLLDGVFIGATRTREMRNVMIVSVLGIYLPAWYVLQPMGNHGLWLAMMAFLGARGAGMALAYRQHRRWFAPASI